MSGLQRVHAMRVFRSGGIYFQWKQWLSDEKWSTPILILTAEDMPAVSAFRPPNDDMAFPNEGRPILDWINRLEASCSSTLDVFPDLSARCTWLRQAVCHTAPGAYAPGLTVGELVRDLASMPARRPARASAPTGASSLPPDTLAQQFPGSDVPRQPAQTLVQIEGITHRQGERIKSNVIVPGSLLVLRGAAEAAVHGHKLPFLVGVALESSSKMATSKKLLVSWMVPGRSKAETYRAGRKKDVIDIFGPWMAVDALSLGDLKQVCLPEPLVNADDILEWNFDLEEQCLPYETLDQLRLRHDIDVTGLALSLTPKGNLYRSYALTRGAVA